MDDKQIVLYVARHGQTTLNAKDCFRGKADPSLDQHGFRDANALAHYFSNIDLSAIHSSDKLRARQTASAIANRRDESFKSHKELRALNVGDFSGQPKSPENVEAMEYYIEHPSVQIPGGESLDEFKQRVQPVIVEAINTYEQTGVPVLLVGHSSIVHEVGSMFNSDHHSARVEPGGVTAVFMNNGDLRAEPIFKPLKHNKGKVDTVS